MANKTVLLVSHGSKATGFEEAMKKVAAALTASGEYREVACAYLEVNSPSIPEGIESLVRGGATEIIVMPYFLLTGKHVIADIPGIIRKAKAEFKNVDIKLAPYLGFDEKIVAVVQKRISEAS